MIKATFFWVTVFILTTLASGCSTIWGIVSAPVKAVTAAFKSVHEGLVEDLKPNQQTTDTVLTVNQTPTVTTAQYITTAPDEQSSESEYKDEQEDDDGTVSNRSHKNNRKHKKNIRRYYLNNHQRKNTVILSGYNRHN